MCGIAGIFEQDGRAADPDAIAGMLAQIVHRGPDGTGTWHSGPLALGHTRLKILDLSDRAAQPMVTSDGQGVLVYNGEVYNYRELREELTAEGAEFRSSGDTEVVLEALHRWGPEAAIPRFDGMFALAYFDCRAEALWLARDRAGIKPLVVAEVGRRLIFASEAKAVLASPYVASAADERSMMLYLLWEMNTSVRTGFSGLRELAAGTWRKITRAGTTEHRYFHVLDNVDPERIVAAAKQDVSQFVPPVADTLKSSVDMHLASDVPVAAMCSGGVDSSLIAAYASDRIAQLPAYVADIDGPENETAQARRVAEHIGISIHSVRYDRTQHLRLWPVSIWHCDTPIYHVSEPALMAVVRRCRADGVRVLLTGEGSDELFGGYDRYVSTYRSWRRLDLARRMRIPEAFYRSQTRRLDAMPFRGAPLAWHWNAQKRFTISRDANIETLPNRIMAKLAAIEPAADRALIGHCLFEFHYYFAWLLHRHDRIGMSASLEMRVPFLENRLIDLAHHLPRKAKLNRGRTKWVIKEAARSRLPADVVDATKKGFPVPHNYSVGTERLLSGGLLAQQFEWTNATASEIIKMAQTENSIRFRLVSLELWLRIFFDRADPEELGERLLALAA